MPTRRVQPLLPCAAKYRARARLSIQIRQRLRGAKRERGRVLAHRLSPVGQAVAPDLQRAQLSDSVLDVVEGVLEEVRLKVPARDALGVKSAPVDRIALESPPQLEPLLVARVRVATFGCRVHPLLERIHRRAVREEVDGPLEKRSPPGRRAGLRVV